MNRHQTALTLAATAVDFSLTVGERATLDGHLAACDSCTHTAHALRSDAAVIASLPVPRLDRRRAEALLAGVVDAPAPGRPVFRLVAVMAVLTLLALGSLAVGAEMLRRAEQKDLSLVPPLPSPSTVVDASPIAGRGIGLSWTSVTMPGWTVPDPGGSTMNGVIAGGPGAIAWGWAYGVPAQVWTTTDGLAWDLATIPFPADADPEYQDPGSINSIIRWGSGYVAAGFYHRLETGRRSLVWTSPDGRAWTPVPHDSVFEIGIMDNLVAWRGELLAFGHAPAEALGGGAGAQLWSSPDGVSWKPEELRLPDGLTMGFAVATSDGLWAYGATAGVDTAGDGESVILSSIDGRTWTRSPLPRSSGQLVAPSGELLGLLRQPGFDGADRPGIYRTTDLETWQVLSGDAAAVGFDVVDVGNVLVMVGNDSATENCGDGCHATGWRSTDGGRTWQAVPADGPGGTMHHVAALADGTLVAVGDRIAKGAASPAAWVSVPVTAPTATPEPSPVPTASTAPIARSWESIGSIPVDEMMLADVVGFEGGYVAIERGDRAWFSADGVTWQASKLPFTASTSKNGLPLGAHATAIASDGQRVVVVGGYASEPCQKDPLGSTGGGPQCPLVPLSWTSSDGRTWTNGLPVTGLTPPPDKVQGAEFDAAWPVPTGGWDASVGWWEGESLTGRDLLHSVDGLTWSQIEPAPVSATGSASGDPFHHEAVADTAGRRLLWETWYPGPASAFAMSDDGTSWTAIDGPPGDAEISDALAAVAGGPWLLAGQAGITEVDQGRPTIWASPEGRTWEAITLPLGDLRSGRVARLVREGDGYIALGYRLDDEEEPWLTAWHSPDGRAWTLTAAALEGPQSNPIRHAAIGPAGTIAVVSAKGGEQSGEQVAEVLRLR